MMTPNAPKQGYCAPTKIASRLRFDPKSGAELTPEEIRFGRAMSAYLAEFKKANPTCGEVLDCLMSLGYRHDERDFEACVREFTAAVHAFKRKKRRPFPTWSEVLSVAEGLGWRSG